MSEKMNVLFIITDQHRADHMSCSGNPILKTPNLDRLANDGIRFTNAFCANPMCMPNRSSILTGVYPNVHGCRSNGINLPLDIPTFVQTLRNRGYQTFSTGKMHLQFFTPPFKRKTHSAENIGAWLHEKTAENMRKNFPLPYYGFDEVEIVLGHGDLCTGHYSDWLEERAPQFLEDIRTRFTNFFNTLVYDTKLPEQYYNTTYVEERTIAFLERYSSGNYGEKPFFLHCSFPDPHHPVCPPGRYKDMYKPEDIELPPTFNDIKNLYNHKFLGLYIKDPIFRGAMLRESPEEEVRKFIASTYGSITMVDNAIGRILASFQKLGLDENTMVIYTSDHGDLCGDHGMLLKGPSPFNGVLQVPLIWKVPGVTKPAVSEALVSSIDLSKTILTLLGIRERHHPPDMQGVDITPILKDPNEKVRDCCLIEEDEEVGPLKIRLRHLITETHKITTYAGLKDYGDIFDRKNDPNELHNLWYDNKELRYMLLEKLYHENLNAQSRLPKRQSPS